MTKKYVYLFFIALILQTGSLKAQESIMPDVSYVLLEKLIATAKENLPTMDSYEAKIRAAKTNVSRESLSWLDAFSFSYVYNPNNTLNIVTPNIFNGYQVGVNFNLSTLLQKPSNVKLAKENVKVAEFDLAQYHITLEAEVKRRYFAYIQSVALLKLQTKMTSESYALSQDLKLKYQKSEIPFEQYTASQLNYSNGIQAKIGAETNFLSAKAALEELLNKKIEEVQ